MKSWSLFLATRLIRLALVLAAVALVAFALAKMSPVDPINAYLGPDIAKVGPEQRERIAALWGLDQPVGVQFAKWFGNILSGDLGWSVTYNAPVAEVIGSRFRTSLVLMGLAWVLSGVLGFTLGVVAGTWQGGWADRIIRVYAYVLASTPTFWIAILLLMVFSVGLGWTPVCCAGPVGVLPEDVTTLERIRHLLLPLAALSILGISQIALHTRAKIIEIMRSDYVLYAEAQGASRLDIAVRHGARNAMLPAITVLFASLGELFGGSVLAEQVFAYPGLGRATIEAGVRGDVPLLLAITLFTTLFVSLGNMTADGLYRLVDPRMTGADPDAATGYTP
ncbi:ABC transporter permease [Kaistia sp. 32K]|uniref:ABC transporter permease n=1 Tax=Kaistia sp. 32K TaxID=2795690 RepID=UPI001937FF5E|nr:ABC transporter permease [Kaistia sp. 32K]BCP55921.1 ABC transporter permease [Kaistia sp. 32K]